MEQVMEELYQKAAVILNDLILEDWNKVYLCADMFDGGGSVFFYYLTDEAKQPVYCYDAIEKFQINEDEYMQDHDKLYEVFKELWNEFMRTDQEVWSNLTFILDNTGNFKLEYGYDDVIDSNPIERHVIWAYKHLGIVPEDDWFRSFLDNYLREQGGNSDK